MKKLKEFDLSQWEHILDFGSSFAVYGRGRQRAMVDKATGKLVVKYEGESATWNKITQRIAGKNLKRTTRKSR